MLRRNRPRNPKGRPNAGATRVLPLESHCFRNPFLNLEPTNVGFQARAFTSKDQPTIPQQHRVAIKPVEGAAFCAPEPAGRQPAGHHRCRVPRAIVPLMPRGRSVQVDLTAPNVRSGSAGLYSSGARDQPSTVPWSLNAWLEQPRTGNRANGFARPLGRRCFRATAFWKTLPSFSFPERTVERRARRPRTTV